MVALKTFNVADRLEKRSLLFAINCVAALSIFFFGKYRISIIEIHWKLKTFQDTIKE